MPDERWDTTWKGVNPSRLRSWSDCFHWSELDYFISARASMDHVNIMMLKSRAEKALDVAFSKIGVS